MKLLYITPGIYNPAGTERVLSMKVNYLIRECGYEVVIVTTDQRQRDYAYTWDQRMLHYDLGLNYDEDFEKNILRKWWIYQKKNRLFRKKLQEIIDHEQPDICISLFGKELEWWNKMRVPRKSIAELHFYHGYRKSYLLGQHQGWIWEKIGDFRVWQMIRQTLAFDMLIVLTQEAKRQLEHIHPHVAQMYNPIPNLNIAAQTDEVRKEKTVIAVGRLSDLKNYPSMARMWAKVEARHPDWTLKVWGEGEDREKIEAEIRRLGLKHMLLCGQTDHIGEQYDKSAIHVMSSKCEGFSMVMLEALSHGLPMVSYNCPTGPQEVINHGENGFLISMGHEQDMADAICRLIEDESLRQRMGEASRKKAKLFTEEYILPQWSRLLEQFVQH